MKRFTSLFLAAGLILGAFCVGGCESSSTGARPGHDAQFGVGDGEFGTSTAIAGDYPSELHHANTPTTQPSN